jgi:putative ABC transport system permease protein
VLWLILRRGGRLAATGLAIGLAASLGLTRLLASLLFDTATTDPITFASGVAVLALVAIAACLIPGIRAMRINPMVTQD